MNCSKCGKTVPDDDETGMVIQGEVICGDCLAKRRNPHPIRRQRQIKRSAAKRGLYYMPLYLTKNQARGMLSMLEADGELRFVWASTGSAEKLGQPQRQALQKIHTMLSVGREELD